MMKKIIPVLIALILIGVIVAVAFGKEISDKYSYSKEMADLDAYYGGGLAEGNGDGELAIILQNERIDDRARVIDNHVYFELATVKRLFTNKFFISYEENCFLYTGATDTLRVTFGEKGYTDGDGQHTVDYAICVADGEQLYFAQEFLKRFANFTCERYEKHVQLYFGQEIAQTYTISKDTNVRIKGGIKSEILRKVEGGETVVLLEEMDKWSKVKTSDAIIGYVENKYLKDLSSEIIQPEITYTPEEIVSLKMDSKVILGWHAIGGIGGNDTLDAMLEEGKGINVIAPTWFSLTDNDGNFRSFASQNYVKKAHAKGLQVWGVWDDFNYKMETNSDISTYQNLCSTEKRKSLAERMVATAVEYGLDGINLDFEKVNDKSGPYYVQFIRELSVLTRQNNLLLSVDNYMPNAGNTYYRLDIQGEYADYVILMGYDEHWQGCENPGSVASIGFVTTGIEKTLETVPAQKVVNALPFYMILWKTEGAKVTDSYVIIKNLEDFKSRMGAPAEWDEETCQNYAEWNSSTAKYQIWLEDEDSLQTKLNVMIAHKLGGVAVWRLGYGTPDLWKLVAMFGDL